MCARLHKHVRETMARHEKTEGGAQVEEVCEDMPESGAGMRQAPRQTSELHASKKFSNAR